MSVTKISDFAVGDVNFNAMMSTLNRAYKGQAQITISEYDTDSAPDVKVGSVFDNNGAQYAVSGTDETPTGYSGISNSTTFYLYFDESALAFIYSSTAPTWSDDLQGWYNGNDRALFSMYKDSGGTLYQLKAELSSKSENQLDDLTVQNNLTVNTGIIFPAYGEVGTIVVAGSTDWARSTQYLPGTEVSGSSLIVSNQNATTSGSPLSAYISTGIFIHLTTSTNLGLTGTWRLLSRVFQADSTNSDNYTIGLLQRIS